MTSTTNLKIRMDNDIKYLAENNFSELNLSITTAAAIEEGRRIAVDSSVKGYTNIDELKAALE
jgi:DNA-damage-inducible protein J